MANFKFNRPLNLIDFNSDIREDIADINTVKTSTTNLGLTTKKSPEEFGAKGDGVTDDKIAIQAALNSNYDIHFLNKVYYCSNIIVLSKSKTITADIGATLLFPSGQSIIGFKVNADNFRIDNLKFTHNKTYIQRPDGTDSEYENWLNIRHTDTYAVLVENAKNGLFVNCSSILTTHPFYVKHSENIGFIQCTAKDSFADGFHFTGGSKHCYCDHCYAINNSDDAFATVSYDTDIYGKCEDIKFVNNTSINTVGHGLACVGPDSVVMSNNKIIDSFFAPISVRGNEPEFGTLSSNGVIVTGNICTQNSLPHEQYSIEILECSNVVCSDNKIKFSAYDTIRQRAYIANAIDIIFSNNYCEGINMMIANSRRIKVIDNTFYKPVYQGIYIFSASAFIDIKGNKFGAFSAFTHTGNIIQSQDSNHIKILDNEMIESDATLLKFIYLSNVTQVTMNFYNENDRLYINNANCTYVLNEVPLIGTTTYFTATPFKNGQILYNNNLSYIKNTTGWVQLSTV